MNGDTPGATRQPRVFDIDDATVMHEPADAVPPWDAAEAAAVHRADGRPARIPAVLGANQPGLRWGLLALSSAAVLVVMALLVQIWTFVADLFQRGDWIGWTALTFATLLCLSALMLILGEIIGFVRLGRIKAVRAAAERLAGEGSGKSVSDEARDVGRKLLGLYGGRVELAWALDRYRTHEADIMTPAERLALLDRTVQQAVDDQVRTVIAQSARRVAVVTAVTPFIAVDILFVLYENLRMLRRIATLYGGRPGGIGLLRLAGSVLGHMIAAGGIALTDDLIGQFIGQGLVKRLSARAGEGLFNAALTARIGIAAVDLCRPLPFLAAPRIGFRELATGVVDLWRTRS